MTSTENSSTSTKSTEGETVNISVSNSGDASSGSGVKNFKITLYDKDRRIYQCKTWHLEPTVR